jgi:hypothetical protein
MQVTTSPELIQDVFDAGNAIAGRDASPMILGKAGSHIYLVVTGKETLIAKILAPVDNLIDEGYLLAKLLGNPLGDEQTVGDIISEEAAELVNVVRSILEMADGSLDLAQRFALGEGTLDVRALALVDQAIEVKIVEHVLERTIGEVLADSITDSGVVSVETLEAVGRQVIKVPVEERNVLISLPLASVALP